MEQEYKNKQGWVEFLIDSTEQFDVVIIGAGMSGIQSAYYLQRDCLDRSFIILESRQDLGGTWDLFKYPGVRSDSYMYPYGYSFNQWPGTNEIANGNDIKNYIRQTAEKYNIDQRIRYNHKVTALEWKNDCWHISIENQPTITSQFIMMCAGYFDYDTPHIPEIINRDRYIGKIIHPQHWPEVNYKNKDITIIGSGATMVTLAPELAKQAKSVTVIQRSPGYTVSVPKQYHDSMYKQIWDDFKFWKYCRNNPIDAAKLLSRPGYDTPNYYPWEHRLCVTIDNEFFDCVNGGKIKLITSLIDSYVTDGVKLVTGQIIHSDIVVTATGLNIKLLGGINLIVNDTSIDIYNSVFYRGTMFTGVPNLAVSFGYLNQSYTLRCNLISKYVVRILNYMKEKNLRICIPDVDGLQSNLPLQSNYLTRIKDKWPSRDWEYSNNYFKEWVAFKFCDIEKGMIFK